MRSRSIFDLIGMIHRRLFFFIGEPGASANYVSVENVVDALMLSGTHPCASGRTYIVSEHRTMEFFVHCIADALGAPRPFLRLPESPIRAASRLLSPLPFVPLTEARVDALVGRAVYCTQRIE